MVTLITMVTTLNMITTVTMFNLPCFCHYHNYHANFHYPVYLDYHGNHGHPTLVTTVSLIAYTMVLFLQNVFPIFGSKFFSKYISFTHQPITGRVLVSAPWFSLPENSVLCHLRTQVKQEIWSAWWVAWLNFCLWRHNHKCGAQACSIYVNY